MLLPPADRDSGVYYFMESFISVSVGLRLLAEPLHWLVHVVFGYAGYGLTGPPGGLSWGPVNWWSLSELEINYSPPKRT